jgi:hypothetical protein
LGDSGYPIPAGRSAKIFTAEDAEDAETKTEGKRERIEVGRASPDGSRRTAAWRRRVFEDERGRVNRFARLLGVFLRVLCVLCGEK